MRRRVAGLTDVGGADAGRALPRGWRRVRLDAICEIQLGKMLSPKSKTGRRPRPYLRNTNVQWNSFDLSDILHMDFSEREEAKFALKPGDLLVCEGGEPGRAAVWQGQIAPCFYQKALHRLRPIDGQADSHFMMYRLWLGAFTGEFGGEHTKTTIAHLPAVRLGSLAIDVPSLSEQTRIVALLSDQMAAVERAGAAAEAQLDAAKAVPAAHLQEMFASAETLRWPEARLGEILRLRKEVVHPSEKPRGRTVFVGLEHIASGTGIRDGSVPVEMAELTGRKPKFFEGDIVYGYLRPYLNKVWVAEFSGLCSVDQYVYSLDSLRADRKFVSAFMRSQVYLRRAPIGNSPGQLPRIRTEEVASVMINLPPLPEQQRMVAEMERYMVEAERTRTAAEEEISLINTLPAALLRRAFSGEL